MDTVKIRSLAEFTRLIEETCVDQSDVLFRGQSGDFLLLPSIARERLTDDLLEVEQTMLEEFQRHSFPYLRVPPATIWEWVALAQHHGLPTRLLDWSLNPLTSLWFAVQRPASQGRNGVLWIFRPSDPGRPVRTSPIPPRSLRSEPRVCIPGARWPLCAHKMEKLLHA